MLMVSTSHSHLFGRRCENVKLRRRISIATQLRTFIFALCRRISELLHSLAYSLYSRKCEGGNAPIGASSLSKSFRSTPLSIYTEQSGPKTPGQRRCNLSEEHHTDGAAICVLNVYLSRAFKNLIQLQHLLSTYICRSNLKQSWIHAWFMCRLLYKWTSYKFYGEDSF